MSFITRDADGMVVYLAGGTLHPEGIRREDGRLVDINVNSETATVQEGDAGANVEPYRWVWADGEFQLAPDLVDAGWTIGGHGNAVPPPEPPAPDLRPLAPWQFWAMLRITGHDQDVRDFVAALDEPFKSIASAQLEFSTEFRRDHPLVEGVRDELGMTGEELDMLWNQGHQLAL